MPFDAIGDEPLPQRPISDANLLCAARDLIAQPWCWLQGNYKKRDIGFVSRCAVNALGTVCGNPSSTHATASERRLAGLLVQEMPRRGGIILRWLVSARCRVIIFNDARNTTHADVLALFDQAIDRQYRLILAQIMEQ